ncbi:MAG: citrate lyase beta subunit [Myxococcota bacterium]|jgi:citrate lyase beta subunit
MTQTTFTNENLTGIRQRLNTANAAFADQYPGERPDRQPVHTVYGGAHIFKASTAGKLGQLALRSMSTYAPDAASFADALGIPAHLAEAVYGRVKEKLEREAVEDFRIDFEDGYGNRPDAEEDAQAVTAATEVAKGMKEGTLPPFIGIRIKPLTEELAVRSIRTLDIFVTTLAELTGGKLPENFVVTLPKVSIAAQVTAAVELFEVLEQQTQLSAGALKMEIMIETTQAIVGPDGKVALTSLVQAAQGRCTGCHFGTYDYTASCSITAAYQKMDHPACDFATQMMQVALGQTGVWMSDGATVVMPVGPHRAAKDGPPLTDAQKSENTEVVHRTWKQAYDHNMHSLTRGIYQGWDLHPGQLPIRYAAVFTFFLESLDAASARLKNFVDKAAQATLIGDTFDDAATGQGLLNYFLRALNSGAITMAEVADTGLSMEELQSRSFVKILDGRAG